MNKKLSLLFVFTFRLALSSFLSNTLIGAELHGVKMPDHLEIGGQKLVLNGMGTRKATWFKVKVYVGGLYLEKKSSNYKEFTNFKGLKHIRMHFVRSVGKDDLVKGWKEGFENVLSSEEQKKLSSHIETFLSFQQDVEEGDQTNYSFTKDGVVSMIKGQQQKIINNLDFSKALFSIWFKKAKDKGLRDGLLGKS